MTNPDLAALSEAHIDDRGRWCVYPCQKVGPDGQRLARECRVPVSGFDGPMWNATGPKDAPTLSPSIDCTDKPCWHGFIRDGKVCP